MAMINGKDIGYPCQVCNLLNECMAKGMDNMCGAFKAMDKIMFASQRMKWFIFKKPIRKWLFHRQNKHLVIDKKKYKEVCGDTWMFDKDPFPEWTMKNP